MSSSSKYSAIIWMVSIEIMQAYEQNEYASITYSIVIRICFLSMLDTNSGVNRFTIYYDSSNHFFRNSIALSLRMPSLRIVTPAWFSISSFS